MRPSVCVCRSPTAALVFLALNAVGVATVLDFPVNSEVGSLAEPTSREILVSAFGAVAGVIMLLSYRRYVIPGALIALGVIPAAAMTGIALTTGDAALAYEGLKRFALDVLLIISSGLLIVLLKQAFVHRRRPMV